MADSDSHAWFLISSTDATYQDVVEGANHPSVPTVVFALELRCWSTPPRRFETTCRESSRGTFPLGTSQKKRRGWIM